MDSLGKTCTTFFPIWQKVKMYSMYYYLDYDMQIFLFAAETQ